MTDENIEFVDREYVNCPRVKPSRSIRTRSTSFASISERFRNFRIQLLEKKLEKKREQALTKGYDVSSGNYEEKIAKSAEVIARLEEKIMVLSRENVPDHYVSRRAIKLRKSMSENLTWNTGRLYSVGMEHYDEIFAPDEELLTEKKPSTIPYNDELSTVTENPAPVMAAAAIPSDTADKINVVPSDLERKAIVDVINSSFGDKEKEVQSESADVEEDDLKSEEIKNVIDEHLRKLEEQKKTESKAAEEENELNSERIKAVIDEHLRNLEEKRQAEASVPTIEKEEVKEAVDEAFKKMEPEKQTEVTSIPVIQPITDDDVDKAVERVRVSRNNVKSVNPTLFDDNGNRVTRHKKYNYTPMTDEEIRQSQIKLGFDEHGNLIGNNLPKKEEVSSARVVGNFIAPGSMPSLTLKDVFVPTKEKIEETPIREVPVVVPERKANDVDLEFGEGEAMFDIVDPNQNQQEVETPVVQESPREETTSMTVEDYTALKEKILRLQQQRKLTQKNREAAQKRANDAAIRAEEAKRIFAVSQANYNERMEKLRAYTKSLEDACDENVRRAEEAERNARMSDTISQEQRHKAEKNIRIIGEIDSMIGEDTPEATDIAVARR